MLTFREVLQQALRDKNKKKTDTGQVPDTVDINPNKEDTRYRVQTEEVLDEAVVSLGARIKRAQNMRKYRSRLTRGKKIAMTRMADAGRLRAKTQNLARRVVRKQITGTRGWEYQKLSSADKIAIDKMIDSKIGAVKRVAARLAPRVRQAEVKRYASRASGRGTRGTLSYVKQ